MIVTQQQIFGEIYQFVQAYQNEKKWKVTTTTLTMIKPYVVRDLRRADGDGRIEVDSIKKIESTDRWDGSIIRCKIQDLIIEINGLVNQLFASLQNETAYEVNVTLSCSSATENFKVTKNLQELTDWESGAFKLIRDLQKKSREAF